jgi:hypothetical protein
VELESLSWLIAVDAKLLLRHVRPTGPAGIGKEAVKTWDGIFPVGGVGIVEYRCVSGSLAYSRILYEQMESKISTLTLSTVRKFSRRFAPTGLSILGYFCVFGQFAYLRIAGFPIPGENVKYPYKVGGLGQRTRAATFSRACTPRGIGPPPPGFPRHVVQRNRAADHARVRHQRLRAVQQVLPRAEPAGAHRMARYQSHPRQGSFTLEIWREARTTVASRPFACVRSVLPSVESSSQADSSGGERVVGDEIGYNRRQTGKLEQQRDSRVVPCVYITSTASWRRPRGHRRRRVGGGTVAAALTLAPA